MSSIASLLTYYYAGSGFVYGSLDSYVNPDEIRISNWNLFKRLSEANAMTGKPLTLSAGRLEMYIGDEDKISLSASDNLLINLNGSDLYIYPFVPFENEQHIFNLSQDAQLTISNGSINRSEEKKFETYNCTLKPSGQTNKLTITDSTRDGFSPQPGDKVFISWQVGGVGQQLTIDSVLGSTITFTTTLSGSIASDTAGNCGFRFNSDVSLTDYNTYGDFWYYNTNDNFVINYESSLNPTGNNTIVNLNNITISKFDTGINASAKDLVLNLHGTNVFESNTIGIAYFGADYGGTQLVNAYNDGDSLQFIDNGKLVAGAITAATANNILGSGAYLHPNIQAQVKELILTDNLAGAWRQYSASGPKTIAMGAASQFDSIIATGNTEYDFLSSNSMPTTIEYIESSGIFHPSFDVTINGGQLNSFNGYSLSQPAASTPFEIIVNDTTFVGLIRMQFDSNRQDQCDVILTDCIITNKAYESPYVMIDSQITAIKRYRLVNCHFAKGNITTLTPGTNNTGSSGMALMSIDKITTIEIVNFTSDYQLGYLFLSNALRTSCVDIEINGDFNIREMFLINASSFLFKSGTISGVAKFDAFHYLNSSFQWIGKYWYQNVSPQTGSKSKSITNTTIGIINGSTAITGVLLLDFDADDYTVGTGNIRNICPQLLGISNTVFNGSNIFSGVIGITATGGDVTIEGFDGSNQNGNIIGDHTITSGNTLYFSCDPSAVTDAGATQNTTEAIYSSSSVNAYQGAITEKLTIPGTVSIITNLGTSTVNSDGSVTGGGLTNGYFDHWSGNFYINGTGITSISVEYDYYDDPRCIGVWSLVTT